MNTTARAPVPTVQRSAVIITAAAAGLVFGLLAHARGAIARLTDALRVDASPDGVGADGIVFPDDPAPDVPALTVNARS